MGTLLIEKQLMPTAAVPTGNGWGHIWLHNPARIIATDR